MVQEWRPMSIRLRGLIKSYGHLEIAWLLLKQYRQQSWDAVPLSS